MPHLTEVNSTRFVNVGSSFLAAADSLRMFVDHPNGPPNMEELIRIARDDYSAELLAEIPSFADAEPLSFDDARKFLRFCAKRVFKLFPEDSDG